MSAVVNGGDAAGSLPRLGAVLIEHGLLSKEQLAAALEEQRRSGRPLGETLVGLGLVSGPVVAQALATQQGGMVKTEYGFATGFGSQAPGALAEPPPTSAPAPEASERAPHPVQAAPVPAPAPAPDPRDAELLALRRRVEQCAALEAQAASAAKQLSMLEAVSNAAREALATATAERDAATEELHGLTATLDARSRRCEELEAELAELRTASTQEQAAPAPEPEPGFLALVRTPEGYRLLEIEGRAPAVGSSVQLPSALGGDVREVLSVGSSPLPASALRCAHLI